MLTDVLFPTFIKIDTVSLEGNLIRLGATSVQTEIQCPLCQQPANRTHSHYDRTVADLPWAEFRFCLELTVQRFFCDNEACQRKIFTERLPDFVAPSARRTLRLMKNEKGPLYYGQRWPDYQKLLIFFNKTLLLYHSLFVKRLFNLEL